ncbi:amino acid adenylation domain-containing protein [Micromonospora sp. NPDC023644]|uniref:amino acid adenylation domain-containing protein n=1 Tax=Micromonospora sp. NPDC023644 TaxID=3154321 RepID=UPI0033F2A791
MNRRGPRTVLDRVRELAAVAPSRAAVTGETAALDYAGVVGAALAVADRLRAAGCRPGDRVGVCLGRDAHLPVALLGIHAAGGAFVPLDPHYPAERVALMTQDAGCRAVLVDPVGAPVLADGGATRVELGADMLSTLAAEGGAGQAHPAGADDIAYLLYTSGSTGRPKGVLARHAGLAALCGWADDAYDAADLADVAATTSVCFDIALFELLVTLALGGHVRVLPGPLGLLRPGVADGVSLLNAVPSVYAELLRAGKMPPVRVANIAGEPLSRWIVDELYAAGVGRVVNLYGPTEDTVYSTAEQVPVDESDAPAIGRPLPATIARIGATPAGEAGDGPGELWLGGRKVAAGYHGQPEQTAARFHVDADGTRWYRTGDLVRRGADGRLHFLGRLDRQLKIRGFRVEPGEVESHLLALPRVRHAAVLANPSGGLAAFVTGDVDADSVRDALAARLPEHLVPQSIHVMAALPQGPNGKADRAALAAHLDRPDTGRDDADAVLCRLWREILGTPGLDTDDFFAQGGTSLAAVRLVESLHEQTGIDLPVDVVYERRTLGDLRDAVAATAPSTSEDTGTPQPGADDGVAVLSARQRVALARPRSRRIASAHLVDGPLDLDALRLAAAAVVRRHATLRWAYTGGPQPSARTVDPYLPELDVADVPGPADPSAVARLVAQVADVPFALSSGRALRLHVRRLADQRWLLVVVVQHLSADLRSVETIHRDLGAAYRGEPLAPPPPAFSAFAAGPAPTDRAAQAADALVAHPPLADPVSLWSTGRAPERATVDSGPDAADHLSRAARAAGVTEFAVCLAALVHLLGVRGALGVPVVSSLDGRPDRRYAETVGWFNNRLLFQAPPTPRTAAEALAWADRQAGRHRAYRDVPYAALLDELRSRIAVPRPLEFFYTDRDHRRRGALDLGAGLRTAPVPAASFDDVPAAPLRLAVTVTDEGIRVELDGVGLPAPATKLAEEYLAGLRAVTAQTVCTGRV